MGLFSFLLVLIFSEAYFRGSDEFSKYYSVLISEMPMLLRLVVCNLIVGFISLPVSGLFFRKLSDRGAGISSLVGLVSISYIYFLIVSLNIVPLGGFTLGSIVFVWGFLNIFFEYKFKIVRESFDLLRFAKIQTAFFLVFGFWYWVRAHNPQIYQIERFMDYGFIQSLFNTTQLPLYDFWMSGEHVNYYYFGHFFVYTLLKLSGIGPVPGFFLAISWLFATTAVNVFRLGHDMFLYLVGKGGAILANVAGFVSVFFVNFAGTLHTSIWIYESILYALDKAEKPTFWYADATRFIDNTITEMPVYGFLVADLHPHMIGILSGVLVISTLFVIWKDEKQQLSFKNIHIYIVSFFLGIAYMFNSWDALTLGGMVWVVLFFKYIDGFGEIADKLLDPAKQGFLEYLKVLYKVFLKNKHYLMFLFIPIIAVIFALPWVVTFESPVDGFGFVRDTSFLFKWMAYWGWLVLMVVLFFVYECFVLEENGFRFIFNKRNGFPVILLFVGGGFLFFVEMFYLRDVLQGGEWYRANTVFKVSSQVWLWGGIVSGVIFAYLIKRQVNFILMLCVLVVMSIQAVYPVEAIIQSNLENQTFIGVSQGVSWWKDKHPDDYDAYLYLLKIREELPVGDKVRNLIEAEGESFKDNNFFSTLLGWQSIIGWHSHEWTWRGSYDEVGARRKEVEDFYKGESREYNMSIIDKYDLDYVILGAIEEERYGEELNVELVSSLGEVVFESGNTKVIKVSAR